MRDSFLSVNALPLQGNAVPALSSQPLQTQPALTYYFAPNGFRQKGFILQDRAYPWADLNPWTKPLLQTEEHVETLICLTTYNESGEALLYSLAAIQHNINYLVSIGQRGIADKVAICVIADGTESMVPSMKAMLVALGLYDERRLVGQAEMHIFDSALQVANVQQQLALREAQATNAYNTQGETWRSVYQAAEYDDEGLLASQQASAVAPRILLCLKQKNAGKLDSHWWFFNTFSTCLNPNYCVQMDVGSVPKRKTLCLLQQYLEAHPEVGAVTNSLLAPEPTRWWDVLSLWQYGNYACSNLLHSPSEEFSGYISVMCGQFSLFRWQALMSDLSSNDRSSNDRSSNDRSSNDRSSDDLKGMGKPEHYPQTSLASPLAQYFKGLSQQSIFESNKFLTEDRVLCLALRTNSVQNWKLAYVPEATTLTDVCGSISELLQQRRRWTNGAFACRLSFLSKVSSSLFDRDLTPETKWDLVRALPLYVMRSLMEWFDLSLSLVLGIWIYLTMCNILADIPWALSLVTTAYVFGLVLILVRHILCWRDWLKASFFYCSVAYGTLYFSALLILFCWAGITWPLFTFLSIYVLTCTIARLYSRQLGIQIAKHFIPMVLIDTTMSAMVKTYAFWRVSDCSWGTKGQRGTVQKSQYRRYFLLAWTLSNAALLGVAVAYELYVPLFLFSFLPWLLGGAAGILLAVKKFRIRKGSLRWFLKPSPMHGLH